MDIKLKKFSRKWYMKGIAWIILLVFVYAITYEGTSRLENLDDLLETSHRVWESSSYKESSECRDYFNRMISLVVNSHNYYQSEEYIKEGSLFKDSYVEVMMYDLWLRGEDAAVTELVAIELPKDKKAAAKIKKQIDNPVVMNTEERDKKKSGKILVSIPSDDIISRLDIEDWNERDFYSDISNQFSYRTGENSEISYEIDSVYARVKSLKELTAGDSDYQEFLEHNLYYKEKTKTILIGHALKNYKQLQTELDSYKESRALYYMESDGRITSNISKKQAKTGKAICGVYSTNFSGEVSENIGWEPGYYMVTAAGEMMGIDSGSQDYFFNSVKENTTYFFGIPQFYLQTQNAKWTEAREELVSEIPFFFVCIAMILLMLIYLTAVAGRKPDSNQVHMCWFDRIYSEIQLFAAGAIIFAMLALAITLYYDADNAFWQSMCRWGIPIGAGAVSAIYIAQVRRLKAHIFWNGFLTVRILKWAKKKLGILWKKAVEVWHGGKLMQKVMLCAIAVPVISATWIGTVVMIGVLVYGGYKLVNDYEAIADGVRKVKDGNLNHKIQVKTKGELKELAEDINQVSGGLQEAVGKELIAERMKTELISNVSHDIKTPLTSIITYVDLLKKEDIANEKAKEYIQILDAKSARLKVLTEDLFEAAKATSGSMEVHLEKVDFCSLIKQGLGEFHSKIQEKNLEIRCDIPEQPVMILADGRLMWRVYENLLTNLVKYALPGSRVYLQLTKDNAKAYLTMKNISAYELNIPADELMERFKRGDDSRHSEGSGLGLNIASSLVELQNGSFHIHVDGDLFKTMVELPLVE